MPKRYVPVASRTVHVVLPTKASVVFRLSFPPARWKLYFAESSRTVMRTRPGLTVAGRSEVAPADDTRAASTGGAAGVVVLVVVVAGASTTNSPFITCQWGSHAYA